MLNESDVTVSLAQSYHVPQAETKLFVACPLSGDLMQSIPTPALRSVTNGARCGGAHEGLDRGDFVDLKVNEQALSRSREDGAKQHELLFLDEVPPMPLAINDFEVMRYHQRLDYRRDDKELFDKNSFSLIDCSIDSPDKHRLPEPICYGYDRAMLRKSGLTFNVPTSSPEEYIARVGDQLYSATPGPRETVIGGVTAVDALDAEIRKLQIAMANLKISMSEKKAKVEAEEFDNSGDLFEPSPTKSVCPVIKVKNEKIEEGLTGALARKLMR